VLLSISAETFAAIRSPEGGALVLADIEELLDCLSSSIPAAALSMVGKVLDGSIKVKAKQDGWWQAAWGRHPLGALLLEPEVKRRIVERIREGGWERLKGSAVAVRNVGSHHMFEPVSIDEAVASARVVFDFLPRWWISA
jgi:hypothetical protein